MRDEVRTSAAGLAAASARSWRRFPTYVAAASGVLFAGALFEYGYLEGDTRALIRDAAAIVSCLRAGQAHCPGAGKFPPFQLLITVPALALGASPNLAMRLLAATSTLCFLGLLLVTWRLLVGRSRAVALSLLLVFGSGELIHYSTHSFAEMATAFFALGMAASWLTGKTAWIGATAFLAATTKETAAPLLVVLALLCTLVPGEGPSFWRRERGRFLALFAGLAAAAAAIAGLNEWRFGVPWNRTYLLEARMSPHGWTHARFAAALWLAPNGGWLFFWPLAVAVLACLPWAEKLRAGDRRPDRRLIVGAAAYLVLTTYLASAWWAPFGWWCWGQRLMLPWLPPLLLLAGFAYAPGLARLWRPLVATPTRSVLLALLLATLALPHVASLFRGEVLIHDTFMWDGGCPSPSVGAAEAHHRCIEGEAFRGPSPLLPAYRMLWHPFVRGRALLYTLLLFAGVFLLRTAFEDAEERGRSYPASGHPPSGT